MNGLRLRSSLDLDLDLDQEVLPSKWVCVQGFHKLDCTVAFLACVRSHAFFPGLSKFGCVSIV